MFNKETKGFSFKKSDLNKAEPNSAKSISFIASKNLLANINNSD